MNVEELEELSREHGDAFFFVDLDRFESNIRDFGDAFRQHYPKTRLAYSYKTNYLPQLCSMADRLGLLAEVVSADELDLARRCGVPMERVIYNGPEKSEGSLATALGGGATVHLDTEYQVEIVEQLVFQTPPRIGLRICPDLSSHGPSRFGFARPQLADLVARLRRVGVEVKGLHCHVYTRERSLGHYQELTRMMVEESVRLFDASGPEYLDLGGGFCSPMSAEMRAQFGAVPSFHEYGKAITNELSECLPPDFDPTLILEPGMAVLSDIASFACRVTDVFQRYGRDYALLTGSIHNIQPSGSPRNLPLTLVPSASEKRKGCFDLVGHTCMEHDVLWRGYEGSLGRGDWVVFGNVGAYTVGMKPPFIKVSPAIFGKVGGATELLKRAETTTDWLACYEHAP